jgi:hypothetical protein
VEELASSGPFAVFSARPAGEGGAPAFAVKIYRTADIFGDPEVVEREAAAFLDAARLQQSLPAGRVGGGEGHWAGIYEMGRTEEAAYYVTDLYPTTAQRMVDSRRELDARSLAWVVGGVVDGLAELGEKANGRGHGGLTLSNVLIGGREEIDGSQVALTDPEPDSRLDGRSQAQDLRDLAGLLFQLVTHRAPPKGGEVRTSVEWQRLGAAGEQLRLLCEQLLNPQPGAPLLTFEQIRQKLAACLAVKETKKGGMSVGAKVAIAAVVLIAAGAAVFFAFGHKAGPPVDPITPEWMTAQVQTVSGKLTSAAKKAVDNSDEDREKEATELEPKLKSAKERIEAVRQHTPPQNEAELRSLVAKKTDAETELSDLEARIDKLAGAIVVLDPEQDPRRPDPQKWMAAPLADLNTLLEAVVKDTPTEGEGGPDAAGLRQSVQAFAAKLDTERAKPWAVDGAEPAARKQGQDEIRKAVKDAAAEQKTLKTTLTKARGEARGRLEKYLADQKQLNHTDKIVTSEALHEAFAMGIDTINLSDQTLGWEAVRTKVAELTGWLKGLETDLPGTLDVQVLPGSGLDLKAAQSAVNVKRERALASAAEPMTSGRTLPATSDAAYAAKRAKIKGDFGAHVTGVKQVLADAADIERLLALGFGYDEAPRGGKSIKTLQAGVSGAAAYGEIKGSVESVLARAGDLEQVGTMTDAVRLMGLITSAGQGATAGSVSPVMAAWRKLPKAGFPGVPGDLDRAAEILNATLIPALAKVPDQARRTELETQARDVVKEMWFSYVHERAAGKPDAVAAAFAARTKLGISDAELSKLEPWASYDLERWRLLNDVATVKEPDPKAQIVALQKMVLDFQGRIGAIKDLGDREAIKGMAARLKPFADGKDLDLTHEGPGRVKGFSTTTGDEEGQIVFYTWDGSNRADKRLEFRRVQETADAASYLCTTEMSLGLCIDIVDKLGGKWDDMKALMNPSDPDNDARRGPRVSTWSRDGKMDLARPTNPDKTGMGWHRAITTDDMIKNAYYPQGGAPAKGPDFDDPVDFISPGAAAYVAKLIGCRLPTSAEWTAANAKFPTTDPNLRDAAWAAQHAYLVTPGPDGKTVLQRTNNNADLPNQSMLKPKGIVIKPSEQDGDAAVPGNDGLLYFGPVNKGGGEVFHHLVGNVCEFVLENPDAMNNSPVPPTKDTITALVGKGDQMKVIGGSAISPKEVNPLVPLDFNWGASRVGFSDAGFRLAFSTGAGTGGTGKPAERLAKMLSGTDYLTRTTK